MIFARSRAQLAIKFDLCFTIFSFSFDLLFRYRDMVLMLIESASKRVDITTYIMCIVHNVRMWFKRRMKKKSKLCTILFPSRIMQNWIYCILRECHHSLFKCCLFWQLVLFSFFGSGRCLEYILVIICGWEWFISPSSSYCFPKFIGRIRKHYQSTRRMDVSL